MSRKFIKELSEQQVIDSINQAKREKMSDKPKGFAIANSVKIQDSVSVESTTDVSAPAPTPAPEHDAPKPLSLDDVERVLSVHLDKMQSSLEAEKQAKAELEAALQKERAEKDALKSQLDTARLAEKVLNDIGRMQGKTENVSVPNVNRVITSKADAPQGALKDWFNIFDDCSKVIKVRANGSQYVTQDNRQLNQFVKENKAAVIKDLESWAKANGMLRGSSTISKDAATVGGDIQGGFLSVLSSIMRTNNRQGFIFWQFANTVIDFGKGLGDNIKIPRAAYLPAPNAPEDRLLSSAGAYTRIDSGNQNLSTGVVTAQLSEWGLGRNSQYPPVTLVSFVTAYSMIELLSILNRNLMRDYYAWEDLQIRSLWTGTTRVVYNDKNAVTTAIGDVATAGDDGTLSRKFLASLYGYMKELQIPPFAGNKYGLVVNSTALTQLKISYDTLWHAASPSELQALTEFLNPVLISPGETDKLTGYCGDFENFMIFETNAYGVGGSGAPGVQTESSKVTHTSFAFGSDTIGRGIGTEMEVRFDDDTDFGRATRTIWRSEEGFVQMDVDGAGDSSAVPQQLRVIKVNTLKTAV
jgi:hypothetical protein